MSLGGQAKVQYSWQKMQEDEKREENTRDADSHEYH